MGFIESSAMARRDVLIMRVSPWLSPLNFFYDDQETAHELGTRRSEQHLAAVAQAWRQPRMFEYLSANGCDVSGHR